MHVVLKNLTVRIYNLPSKQNPETREEFGARKKLSALGTLKCPAWYVEQLFEDERGWRARLRGSVGVDHRGQAEVTPGSVVEVRQTKGGAVRQFEQRIIALRKARADKQAEADLSGELLEAERERSDKRERQTQAYIADLQSQLDASNRRLAEMDARIAELSLREAGSAADAAPAPQATAPIEDTAPMEPKPTEAKPAAKPSTKRGKSGR